MPIEIAPGSRFGCDISFDYKGPPARLFVGFAIATRKDLNKIYLYSGSWIDLPQTLDWTKTTVHKEGPMIPNPPEPDQLHDVYVFVSTASTVPAYLQQTLVSRWYEDVYKIVATASEFRNLAAVFF